jgi:hypothetical protein
MQIPTFPIFLSLETRITHIFYLANKVLWKYLKSYVKNHLLSHDPELWHRLLHSTPFFLHLHLLLETRTKRIENI